MPIASRLNIILAARNQVATYECVVATAEEFIERATKAEADRAALLEALKALAPHMEIAFDAEGDTFGIHHNDANDALIQASAVVARVEGRS